MLAESGRLGSPILVAIEQNNNKKIKHPVEVKRNDCNLHSVYTMLVAIWAWSHLVC